MGDRLNNISILAVTLFCVSCSVGAKLDENLAQMQEMNKNMADMNKNTSSLAASADKIAQTATNFGDKATRMEETFNKMGDDMSSMVSSVKEFEKLITLADDFKRLSQIADDFSKDRPQLMALAEKINQLVDKFLDGKAAPEPDVSPEEFFKEK